MHSRKAQITIYIIIGITLLAGILVYLYMNSETFRVPESEIDRVNKIAVEPGSIKSYVTNCIEQISRPLLFQIAENGGTFMPSIYGNLTYDPVESYKDNSMSYMRDGPATFTYSAHWEQGHGYVTNLITRQTMEKELNVKIRENLPDCLSLDVFKGQGYEYEAGDIKIDTKIGVDDAVVTLNYPLTFRQGEKMLTFTEFGTSLDVPLGRAFDLSVRVQNEEAVNGYFETSDWMVKHGVDMKIYQHKPYPDIVYEVAKKIERTGEILRYNFALQGKDTAAEIGESRVENVVIGWCYFPEDQNCYANAKRDDCNVKGGSYSDSMPENCRGATTFTEPTCDGGRCNNCGEMRHGESWCTYDGIVGSGFDLVGSRHFLRTCIDGEIFYEECRDYREEMCVSWPSKNYLNQSILKSTCKLNRWQNCYKQGNALSCAAAGDCFWEGWLEKPDGQGMFIKINGNVQRDLLPLYQDDLLLPYTSRKCLPKVPPGFKHWKGDGAQVCAMGNMLYDGDHESDRQVYADNSNWYCFQMGDCGSYFNFADQYTADGFFNSDALKQENKIRSPFNMFSGTTYSADLGLYAIEDKITNVDRSQITLTGNELTDPQTAFRTALYSYAGFWTKASNEYTKSNFESHIKKHITSLDFPITAPYGIRHIALCNVWTAPKSALSGFSSYSLLPSGGLMMGGRTPAYGGTQMCDTCNKDSEDHKPCSEYRCKSLGQGCIFSYQNGRGICRDANPGDNDPPEIIEATIGNEDYTLTKDNLATTPPPRSFEGMRVCHGVCDDDDGRIDGIEPYTVLSLKVKFSEPTQCKLSYFPSFDYRGIPLMFVTMFMYPIPVIDNKDLSSVFGTEFKEELNIDLPVYPTSEITRNIFSKNFNATIFKLMFFPDDFGVAMVMIANGFSKVANEFGDSSDAQVIDQWVSDYERFRPTMKDAFDSAKAAMTLVLSEQSKGNTILFFDCNDQSGNPNQDFYLKYAVGKDHTPAKLLKSDPLTGANLTENSFHITLFLNEPADCKYEVNEDKAYDDMPYFFTCQLMQTETLDGTFHCDTDALVFAGKNKVYVKCKDQPLPVKTYRISFIKSSSTRILDPMLNESIIAEGTAVFIQDEETLIEEPRINITGDVDLRVNFYTDSVCRYTTDDSKKFMDIPAGDGFSCARSDKYQLCRAQLPLGGENETRTYTIKCVDSEIFSGQRNVNSESFVLEYNR